MRVDIRSASSDQILRLERALRDAVERSLVEARAAAERNGAADSTATLRADVRLIGDRPAAKLSPGSRVLAVMRAVDNRLGNTARVQRASTDANIPLALGRDAVAIGAGGTGGGAHTLHEWYDATDRQLGLERILTAVLTLAGASE
jgi:di/tripeptidase